MTRGKAASGPGKAAAEKPGCAYGLFGVFALFGLLFAAFGLGPVAELWRARSWTPTPCSILSSEVEEVDGDDGSTWRVAVTFRYEVGGVEHVSDRYRVSRISSSGRSGKQRVVDALPPGTSATCYVDPDDPTVAILRRDLGDEWVFVAAGLLFAGFGVLGGLLVRRTSKRKAKEAAWLEATSSDLSLPAHTSSTAAMRAASSDGGPLELASSSRRGAIVLFMVVFAAFWNGVSWPLLGPELLQLLRGHLAGLVPGLFALVFLPIGLGTIVYLGYLVLAWSNPRPKLTLSTHVLRAGSRAELAWQLYGARRRLEDLTILLEGREVSSTGTGKDSHTHQRVFHSSKVVETGRAGRIVDGKERLQIPSDARPSEERAHVATQWVLVVKGTIRAWPDLREEYLLWVHPRADGASCPEP